MSKKLKPITFAKRFNDKIVKELLEFSKSKCTNGFLIEDDQIAEICNLQKEFGVFKDWSKSEEILETSYMPGYWQFIEHNESADGIRLFHSKENLLDYLNAECIRTIAAMENRNQFHIITPDGVKMKLKFSVSIED